MLMELNFRQEADRSELSVARQGTRVSALCRAIDQLRLLEVALSRSGAGYRGSWPTADCQLVRREAAKADIYA